MLKSSSCDYTDAYILVKGTITVNRVGATKVAVQVQADINNKQYSKIFYLLLTV